MIDDKRVAVCLFGQMRTYLQCKDNFDKYFVDRLEPDIFIHTWEEVGGTWKNRVNEKHSEEIVTETRLIDLYSPEKIVIEEFRQSYYQNIESVEVPEKAEFIPDWQKAMIPMFYKMWSSNELKVKKEQNEEFKYDLVILLRPDLLINEPIPEVALRNPDHLWVRDRGAKEHWIDDQFIVSSSSNINYYTSIWEMLNKYWETELGDQYGPLGFPPNPSHHRTHIGIPERLIHFHMEQSDIKVKEMKLDSHILRREPSKLRKGVSLVKNEGPREFTRSFLRWLSHKI